MDIRNENVSKSLGTSLGLHVASTKGKSDGDKEGKDKDDKDGEGNSAPDSANANIGKETSMTQALSSSLEVTTMTTIGGSTSDDDEVWKASLYLNPSLIGFTLVPISKLVKDPARAENLQKVVDQKLKDTSVVEKHKALIMFVEFSDIQNDRESRAHTGKHNTYFLLLETRAMMDMRAYVE